MANEVEIIAIGAVVGFIAWKLARLAARDPVTGEDDNAADPLDMGNQILDYTTEAIDRTDEMTAQTNLNAFLAALRFGEGTAGGDGYNLLCGGGRFDDYSAHPAQAGWGGWQMPLAMAKAAGYQNGAVSTAAGAYQINRPTYKRLAAKLGLNDFSPATQDAMAVELMREKGAVADAMAGRIEDAARKVAKVWASLPGAGYGQREVATNTFLNQYTNAGGTLA